MVGLGWEEGQWPLFLVLIVYCTQRSTPVGAVVGGGDTRGLGNSTVSHVVAMEICPPDPF